MADGTFVGQRTNSGTTTGGTTTSQSGYVTVDPIIGSSFPVKTITTTASFSDGDITAGKSAYVKVYAGDELDGYYIRIEISDGTNVYYEEISNPKTYMNLDLAQYTAAWWSKYGGNANSAEVTVTLRFYYYQSWGLLMRVGGATDDWSVCYSKSYTLLSSTYVAETETETEEETTTAVVVTPDGAIPLEEDEEPEETEIEVYTTNGTMTVQSDLCWCFNPYYVNLVGFDNVKAVKISVGDLTITPALINGSARVDISRLFQLNFDDPKTTRFKTLTINLQVVYPDYSVVAYASRDVSVMWGGLNIGDRVANFGVTEYDGDKPWQICDVQCFRNFPFSIELLCQAGTVISTRYGVQRYSETESIEKNTLRTFTLGVDFDNSYHRIAWRQDIAEDGGDFDESFDYTFRRPADSSVVTRLFMRDETEGYYLRFVDHFGYIRYYLFDTGDKESTSEVSDGNAISRVSQYDSLSFGGLTRDTHIKVSNKVKCCASDISRATLAYVRDIIGSPIVDLYMGKTKSGEQIWQPVRVEAGTVTTNTRHTYTQDFEITIILPTSVTQRI